MSNLNDDDERLRALFHDAVSEVEPRDGLAEVRRRTRARRTSTSRRLLPVLLGAGAVGATVVAATFVVNGLGGDDPDGRPPVANSSTPDPSADAITSAAGIYFISETPTGPRLFREFQAVGLTPDPEQKALLALQRLTADAGPRDPDYVTLWPADSFSAVTVEEDRIVVELGTEATLLPPDTTIPGLYGVQQAVYTAEAALGTTLPVAFQWEGEPAREVLGFKVNAQVDRDTSFTLVAPVNITDPAEQLAIEDGTFAANGTMATYVRDVDWTLLLDGEVVEEGGTAPVDITGPDARATLGAPGWETEEIDVSHLAPGNYEFVVSVIDTGQTSDQPEEFTDTRTISIR